MLLHDSGRIWIIHEPDTLKELFHKRRQVLIHFRDQVAIAVFVHLGGDAMDPVQMRSNRIPVGMHAVFLELAPNQVCDIIR